MQRRAAVLGGRLLDVEVKRNFTAKGKRAKLKVLYGVHGNVLGLDQIAEACG